MHKGGGPGQFDYRLLATNKTSTMQKEMQEAGDAGFEYRGQTVFKTAFGGKEVVAILEKSLDATKIVKYEYRLLATERSYNYKLAATWLTPDVIRATARLQQLRSAHAAGR